MRRSGHVYFIVEDDGDYHPESQSPIKVGISVDIDRRLKQLQTGNPDRLFILGWIPSSDYKELEKKLHRDLASKNIQGEWFRLNAYEVIELLQRHLGNLARDREQLEFIGCDRDGISEFLSVWDWWDFEPEQCCSYCGSFSGMHYNEQLQSLYCHSCDTVEAWENPEEPDPDH